MDSLRTQHLDARNEPPDANKINYILQATAFGLRATYYTVLYATPAQVTFGRDMIVASTYLANRRYIYEKRCRRQLKDNNRENKNQVHHEYKPGDLVFLLDNDVK
eukprot:3109865-Ditylum_brightwellii.AAC.1